MTKKIEHLTTQLKEFFPEENSQALAKKLKHLAQMQEDFSASPHFKKQLKSRLQHIHAMQKKSSFSLLSFLRYSGVFASFFFVSGAGYMYYTMQQDMLDERIVSPSSYVSEIGDVQKSEIQDISSEKDSLGDAEFPSEKNQARKQNITPKQTHTSSQREKSLPQESSRASQGEAVHMSISSSHDDPLYQQTQQEAGTEPGDDIQTDEFIISDIFQAFEDTSVDKTLPSEKQILPMGDTMMLKSISPMMTPVGDVFFETCQSYSGTLSQDGEKCFLDTERFCTRENIFQESESRCEFLPELPPEIQ